MGEREEGFSETTIKGHMDKIKEGVKAREGGGLGLVGELVGVNADNCN